MREGREREHKLAIRVTPEFEAKFIEWAARLGLTRSQLGNICVQSGLNAVIRAVSPEESLTALQIVEIIQAAKAQGMELKKSDFE